jgi:hypothetical protein
MVNIQYLHVHWVDHIARSGWWMDRTPEDIVSFQLFTDRLCMPFDEFHKATEAVLGRPVYLHEFAWADELRKEFLKEKPAPTFEEICALIPEEKRVIVMPPDSTQQKKRQP